MIRAEQAPTFTDTTNRASFIQSLDASLVRDRNRKSQKKVGESCHNVEFNTKLVHLFAHNGYTFICYISKGYYTVYLYNICCYTMKPFCCLL